jgi:hypothetical protein
MTGFPRTRFDEPQRRSGNPQNKLQPRHRKLRHGTPYGNQLRQRDNFMGGSAMISAHALSGLITKVFGLALTAGVVIFVLLLLLTLSHP